MSAPDDREPPRLEDPFLAEDPASAERERRRLQREAKRRGRENRQSLASRVGGALDGAASKGREAIEQTRERAKDPEPSGEGVEPPAFRRTPSAPPAAAATPAAPPETAPPPPTTPPGPAAPPAPRSLAPAASPTPSTRPPAPAIPPPDVQTPPPARTAAARLEEEGRVPADVLMPRREPRRPLIEDTSEADAVPPEPIVAPPERAGAESEEWSALPPAEPREPAAAPGGAGARRRGAATGGWSLWRRRLLVLVAILAIVVGGAYALSKAGGGDDPAPVPSGPKKLRTTSVTIPEGLSAEEMAPVAKKAGLKGSYAEATTKLAKKFKPERYGAPDGAGLEGFLFPATYEVEQGAPAADLVDKQLTEGFEPNLAQVDLGYAKKKNLTVYDVVTIASMIEREVQVPAERPLVAAVIYNRLADGEPLGIDATLRYEVGFDKPLTESQLASDSPYNTRINPDLPPTPIGNPGLDSLQAAANPADVAFKYYVFKPGTCGEHTFTADYDEFLDAQAAYQAALEAEGGQPSSC